MPTLSLWFKPVLLEELAAYVPGTLLEQVGIELTEITADSLSARMPVDHRTIQPAGLLHGGASVVLAESLGSIASALVVDQSKFNCVGLEINANHIRSKREGWVYGTASSIHIGQKTHIWEIRIVDENQKLVCISRLTVAVLPKKEA